MKKIILTYGAIIGAILCANMIVMVNMMYSNPDFKSNDFVGYTTQIIMFSLIFFGVRNYRNNHLEGKITFGRAFKTGALIALVASTVYTVAGLLYYYIFVPDFIDVFIEHVLKNTAPDQVEARAAEMANFKEMYKNPLFAVMVTYLEVLPMGLIVTLISAFIVKKK